MSFLEVKRPPEEDPAILQTFLKFSILRLHGLLGCFAVGAGIAIFQLWGQTMTAQVFAIALGVAGFILIWVVCFFLWKDEREKKDALQITNFHLVEEKKAADDRAILALAKTDSRVQLVGYFQSFSSSEWRAPLDVRFDSDGHLKMKTGQGRLLGSWMCVKVAFLNLSEMQTTIHGFSLVIVANGRKFYSRKPIPMTEKRTLLDDYVADSQKMTVRGQRIEGELFFTIDNLNLEKMTMSEMTLFIEDASGHGHPLIGWQEPEQPASF